MEKIIEHEVETWIIGSISWTPVVWGFPKMRGTVWGFQ